MSTAELVWAEAHFGWRVTVMFSHSVCFQLEMLQPGHRTHSFSSGCRRRWQVTDRRCCMCMCQVGASVLTMHAHSNNIPSVSTVVCKDTPATALAAALLLRTAGSCQWLPHNKHNHH